MPHIGQSAKIEQMNTKTPAKAISGTIYGMSFSKSISFLLMHGPRIDMYTNTVTIKAMHVRAMFKKNVLT